MHMHSLVFEAQKMTKRRGESELTQVTDEGNGSAIAGICGQVANMKVICSCQTWCHVTSRSSGIVQYVLQTNRWQQSQHQRYYPPATPVISTLKVQHQGVVVTY